MPGKAQNYADAAEKLLEPIAKDCGVRIYDVEYVEEGKDNYYLRCYIDRDGGVTIDDCEKVSRAMSDALDREDPIPGGYILEVSSPGLGRTLTKDRHLEAGIGQKVEVKLFSPDPGMKSREIKGILKSFDDRTVTIEAEPVKQNRKKVSAESSAADEQVQELVLERKKIAVIRLAVDF